jgi:hypothetical protein
MASRASNCSGTLTTAAGVLPWWPKDETDILGGFVGGTVARVKGGLGCDDAEVDGQRKRGLARLGGARRKLDESGGPGFCGWACQQKFWGTTPTFLHD